MVVSKRPSLQTVEAHLGLEVWNSAFGSLAYAEVAGYRVAAGEPQCPVGLLREMVEGFEEDCRAQKRRAVYFGLLPSAIENIDPDGMRGVAHLGDVPVFELKHWTRLQSMPRSIRSQMHRAAKHGVAVRHLASPPPDGSALQECLSAWLRSKSLPPLGFATQPFLLDPWPERGVFVAECDDRICGFLVTSHSLFRDMLRVDAIVRTPHAPNGCAELLVATAFQSAALQGFERATLGLAPFSNRSESGMLHPSRWFRIFSKCFRRAASPWYPCAGLEAFKAKFHPDSWQPLYAVSQGGNFSPRDLLAIARAFAGGSLSKYAIRSVLWKVPRPAAI